MTRMERLLEDLKIRLPEREIPKVRDVILAFRELSSLPVSPLYPRGFHPLVRIKKKLGGIEKDIIISPIDFTIINNANMPPWKRIFDFSLDEDFVERGSVMGVPIVLVGKFEEVTSIKRLISEIIPHMTVKPEKVYSFRNEAFMKFEGDMFLKFKIVGSALEFTSFNVPLSYLPRILGRATFVLDSMFRSKNAEFYRLLFVSSLGTFSTFYTFFMRHIYGKLPLEHKEFLEEMHDYKNFLQLIYFHISRMNIDRIQDRVSILIRRRSRPDRPLELEIIFRENGVEVRDKIRRAQIEVLV
ncbi:hypothetical protein [Pyrococcus abyssi]|uniref:Uncharacterized protein n=1 Tax=Pyrococcus abyssi (strain GE5 / Orsay) TaxID=272844 RepID=Q9V0N7_PYRAB|nr:hypothetical protein [Pyrococcus abyssi]CAB49666.1 Hypothetical protein PAB1865 [Pyrococcus abyssi GE5]CCE70148.1 TPA: hypothetical protein PAB1865 [Pyrococcus abyssi GE5]